MDIVSHQVQYSQAAQTAMAGGIFDARSWLKRPGKTGDVDQDERNMSAFRWKIKFMDLAETCPTQLELAVTHFENKALGLTARANKDQPMWPSTYIYFEKVPKYWKADILLEVLEPHGVLADMLTELDVNDPTAVPALFDFITGLGPKTKIYPLALKEKELMREVVLLRITALGRVSKAWVLLIFQAFSRPLACHWHVAGAGCYFVEGESDSPAKFLVHDSGEKVSQ